MIRVTIEVVPHGDEQRKQTLATAVIGNQGERDVHPALRGEDYRTYDVSLSDEIGVRNATVRQHRRSDGFGELVVRALRVAFDQIRYA